MAYGPNYPLNYGLGHRAAPLQPPVQSPQGPTLQPTTPNGQAASLDALRNALMSQTQMGRAGAIRGSMRMPTENKNLISTAYDLWRANNAEDKSIESAVEAAKMQGKAQGEAQKEAMTAKQQERIEKADAVYRYLMSQNVEPEQAKAAAQAVFTGALDAKEVLPKEGKEPSGKAAEFAALKEIYGEDKARQMLATTYQKGEQRPMGKEAEYGFLAELYGPEKAAEMIASGYDTGEGSPNAPVSKLGSENRVKLGLIKNAGDLMARAVPQMFEGDKFRNTALITPKSEVGIAAKDLRESLQSMLRAVSGAAIPETEIEREVDSMLPSVTDTDRQARQKINRAANKIQTLYDSLSAGYELPDQMRLPEIPTFGQMGQSDVPPPPEGFVLD